MALYTIILSTSISDLTNIRDGQCSMHQPRSITSNIIVYAHPVPNSAHFYDYYLLMNVKKILQILNLLINLVIIFNNSCSIHRKCQDFYGVHVYLRSNRISLLPTPSNIYSPRVILSLRVNFTIYLHFLTTHPLPLESTFPNLLHNLFLRNPSRYFFFT